MCKIVIVDNVKNVRESIKTTLEKIFPEHSVYTYASTKKALEEAKELKYVDIVVFNCLNNKIPTGIEFARELRVRHPGAMLIYTTHGEKPNYEHMAKLADFGIDNYLLRPYNEAALNFVIKNSLNRIKSLQTYKSEDHIKLENAVDNLLLSVKEAIEQKPTKKRKKLFKKNNRG